MFKGLTQEKGCIKPIQRQGQTIQLTCQASKELLESYQIGDSMAINGTCLTAINKEAIYFTVDIMPETFKRTTFSQLTVGDEVNLERAMKLSDRLEGHLVAGHIDTTARLLQKRILENALILTFQYPIEIKGEIIAKGSIAIDGVSLTVVDVTARTFSVSLIPHTKDQTTLGQLKQGDQVNIETDMIGKYVKNQKKVGRL